MSHQTHYWSYRGRAFTGQMIHQQCHSTEERWVLSTTLQPHQVHPTVLTIPVWNKNTQINTNKSMHSEMGPVWQNQIQRTVRPAHLSVLIIVHNCHTQHSTEEFWLSSLLTSRQASQLRAIRHSVGGTQGNRDICGVTMGDSRLQRRAATAMLVLD